MEDTRSVSLTIRLCCLVQGGTTRRVLSSVLCLSTPVRYVTSPRRRSPPAPRRRTLLPRRRFRKDYSGTTRLRRPSLPTWYPTIRPVLWLMTFSGDGPHPDWTTSFSSGHTDLVSPDSSLCTVRPPRLETSDNVVYPTLRCPSELLHPTSVGSSVR